MVGGQGWILDREGSGTCSGAIGRKIEGQTSEQTISCQYHQLELITAQALAEGRTRRRPTEIWGGFWVSTRGPTVQDWDRSNGPRRRTRTAVFFRSGTLVRMVPKINNETF